MRFLTSFGMTPFFIEGEGDQTPMSFRMKRSGMRNLTLFVNLTMKKFAINTTLYFCHYLLPVKTLEGVTGL